MRELAERGWLPVLCSAFLEAAPEERGPTGSAIAAYACICAPETVAGFFRTAMQKLIKVRVVCRQLSGACVVLPLPHCRMYVLQLAAGGPLNMCKLLSGLHTACGMRSPDRR